MINKLNEKNDITIYDVHSSAFHTYGNVITGYKYESIIEYLNNYTDIPETGNVYVASVDNMEQLQETKIIEQAIYGNVKVQVGYCNGRNSTYNGFEYHKCSEIVIAATDLMLVLGHVWDMQDNHYHVNQTQVFFVPQNTAVELYQTTLHLSPCKVSEEGFKAGIILLKGTNTPLGYRVEPRSKEEELLLQTNKWVIAHPEREPLIKQGAFPGVLGPNKELFF